MQRWRVWEIGLVLNSFFATLSLFGASCRGLDCVCVASVVMKCFTQGFGWYDRSGYKFPENFLRMAVKIVPSGSENVTSLESTNGLWYFPDNLILGSWIGGGSFLWQSWGYGSAPCGCCLCSYLNVATSLMSVLIPKGFQGTIMTALSFVWLVLVASSHLPPLPYFYHSYLFLT